MTDRATPDDVHSSSGAATARILTWNIERKHPVRSPIGSAALDHLFALDPDVAILTEASADLPASGGHVLAGAPSEETWYRADERKVVLWSRSPWRDTECLVVDGRPDDRAVWGTTETPLGPLRVMGICVPWHMAGTRYVEPKREAWEVHIEFLDQLLATLGRQAPFDVIAGDFNQFRPRTRGSKRAEGKLLQALRGYTIVTEAPLAGCERDEGVDHIALARELMAVETFGWPATVGGQRLSDHEGAGALVARRPS